MTEETLFHLAVQQPAAARAAFLEKMCAGDEALHQRVAALLHAADIPGSFLGAGPVPLGATVDEAPLVARAGGCIGPYKLLQQVGEGGMGTVFMAEQTEPVRRRVALKVIKQGMDTRQVVARFEAERQALALMDHPNIAKVLDAGATEAGRPYFVMELVKGVPLTKYCDEQWLTPRQRLELFVPVCQAVQHAHQKGIIHRDLKPSNVLIGLYDGKPVPKVIDFGVAKAIGGGLTDKTLFTDFGAVIGTLEYMSPEQAETNQLDIDTRSDLYALGVLLYELLTGTTPFERKRLRSAAMVECLRIIREEEPQKPSTRLSTAEQLPAVAANRGLEPRKLTGVVRGDLDWIVMKCLEKDRNRRYETANGLALDVQRYLADEPVLASPPSPLYRLRKFARRHKAALLTTTAALLVGVLAAGGVGWALWDRAAQNTAQNVERAGRTAETEKAVTVALATAEQLARQAGRQESTTSAEAQAALVELREAAAAVAAAEAALTTGAGGDSVRERVAAMRQRIDAARTREMRKEQLFRSLDGARMLRVTIVSDDFDDAGSAALYQRALAAYGLELDSAHTSELARQIRAEEPAIRDALLVALTDWADAAAYLSAMTTAKTLWALVAAADDDPWRKVYRTAVTAKDRAALRELSMEARKSALPSSSVVLLALSLFHLGERQDALAVVRKARSDRPTDFWTHFTLGYLLTIDQKRTPAIDLEEGIGCYRAALALRPDATVVHDNLGTALAAKDQLDEAITEFKAAIKLAPDYMSAHHNLGMALKANNMLDEAIVEYKLTIKLAPKDAKPRNDLGVALSAKGQFDEAIAELNKAIELDPKSAVVRVNLGIAFKQKNRPDAAIAEYKKAIDLDPTNAGAHYNLGIDLFAKNQVIDAIAELKSAIALDPKSARPHVGLGIVLRASNQLVDAIAEFNKAIELDPKSAAGYFSLANALDDKKQPDDAIAAYRKAIELEPQFVSAHVNLGNVLISKNLVAEAIVEYNKAIKLDPKHVGVRLNLGSALKKQHQLDGAIVEYRKAIEIDPKSPAAHEALGLALGETQQLDDAIAEFRQAIALDPKIADTHFNLGFALRFKKEMDDAIAEFRQAIALDSKHVKAQYHLGLALCAKKQLDDGIAAFRNAITIDPTNAQIYLDLGLALYEKRELDAAIAAYRKAIELHPKFAWAYNNLGYTLATKNQLDEAIAAYGKAIEIDPKLRDAHSNLAAALWKQGRFAQAKKSHQAALDLVAANDSLRPSMVLEQEQLKRLAALQPRLADILAGELEPANNQERIDVAGVQQLQGLYLGAFRRFAEAFTAEPRLADDLKAWHRYNAACCAALAASGQGKDVAKLDDMERIRLRKQALDWLRLDLTLWAKSLEGGNAEARRLVRERLSHWQDDTDLAGIHDSAALDKLPAEEREAYRKLWADVAKLVKEAGDVK